MEHRQVDGIDAYGFPSDLCGHPLLAWMGDDYVRYVAAELLHQFREEDAGTEMLGIKCEGRPRIQTSVLGGTNIVRRVVSEFELQVLLQASDGQHWRLRGTGKFDASGLGGPGNASVSVSFDIFSTEEPA